MGRRTSGQQVGIPTLGNVQASAATLTTTQSNQNLSIDPNGTGIVDVISNMTVNGDLSLANQADLRLLEASGNGTNYIAMQAASSMSANYTITWPAAVTSTNGFVLTSDTSGNLTWSSAGGNIPVNDPGSSATVHYPFFGTNAGSLPSTLAPNARTNLQFIPSTGELFATIGRYPDVIGSTGGGGTLTIRGTSSGTKAAASVLMTDNVASTSTTSGTLVVTGGVGVSGRTTTNDLTVVNTPQYPVTENIQTGGYTLALSDRNLQVTMNNTSAATVTIPTDAAVAFPVGTQIDIARVNTGAVTLAAASGVSVTKSGLFAANEVITVRKRATNSWIVIDSQRARLATANTPASAAGYNIHTYNGNDNFVV